jgi:flagellar protein FlbT
MKSGLKISLKANEKIYINGAVVKVDRKVSLELLNETQFLLESHVLQPEDATTPLRQLYFIVQIMLMNPESAGTALSMFRTTLPLQLETFRDKHILSSLKHIDRLVAEERVYEALKAIRSLDPLERIALDAEREEEEEPVRPMAVGAR